MMWRSMISAIAAAAAVGALGCGGPHQPAPRQERTGAGPRVTVNEVKLELTDNSGERVWEASGKGLRAEAARDQGELRDLNCRFLDNGQVAMTATADEGRVDWSQRTVTLSGKVQVQSARGYGEIRADRATWSVADRKLRASGNVRYQRANMTATAPAMTAETALKVVRMTGGSAIRFEEPVAARKVP
jgi:LPS export ABC transporter protein LptC